MDKIDLDRFKIILNLNTLKDRFTLLNIRESKRDFLKADILFISDNIPETVAVRAGQHLTTRRKYKVREINRRDGYVIIEKKDGKLIRISR